VRERLRSTLSAEERAELRELAIDLRGLRDRLRRLAGWLERSRDSSSRALVGDRLRCILLDCIDPALRDIRSIETETSSRK